MKNIDEMSVEELKEQLKTAVDRLDLCLHSFGYLRPPIGFPSLSGPRLAWEFVNDYKELYIPYEEMI